MVPGLSGDCAGRRESGRQLRGLLAAIRSFACAGAFRSLLGLPYEARAEANEETPNQITHQSPSDKSTIITSAALGARGPPRSDWPGRVIALWRLQYSTA
jgi:hypothetical protein